MITVYKTNQHIIIEANNQKITLTENQARYILKKLADTLGYRVTTQKPTLTYKLEPGGLLRIVVHEGKGQRVSIIPIDVLHTFLETLKQLGPGKHQKRKLATTIIEKLVKDKRIKKQLEPYYINGKFDWEKFMGGRDEYYAYFRAPILILEENGIVKSTRTSTITITDKINTTTYKTILEKIKKQKRGLNYSTIRR